jgi:hypothetical protein
VRAGYIPRYFISHEHIHLERAARLERARLAGGRCAIKCQYLSKRARKRLRSYVSLSAFELKSALNGMMAPG